MLDKQLFRECIAIVKHSPCVTVMQIANELKINHVKAKELLDQLTDCSLIVNLGDFYVNAEFIGLN
jgi:predicted ArsR family transcriptional regulator